MSRRKPKSNAVLKNLPPERQDQIAEWCEKPNDTDTDGKIIARTGGLAYAQDQLANDGLRVSLSVLGEFYQWWRLEQDLEISFEREAQVLEKTGDAKKAREAGESLLMRLGLVSQNAKLIQTAALMSDSRRALDLEEESGRTKAAHKERSLTQKDRDFMLQREKFVTLSCEKILQAARDPKIRDIAESKIPNAEKIAAIRKAYFADIDAVEVALPE